MPFIQSIHDFNLIAVHDYLKTIAGFISSDWINNLCVIRTRFIFIFIYVINLKS